MQDYLGLTDEQAKKLEPVLKEQQKELEAMRRETSLSRRDRAAKLREIEEGTDRKVIALLTPTQAEKWRQRRFGGAQLFQPQGRATATPPRFSAARTEGMGLQGSTNRQRGIGPLQTSRPQTTN